MRHASLAVQIWGAFLLLVGVGLLVFNKQWAAWTAGLVPRMPIEIPPRLMTVVVGTMFVFVGGSVFLPIGPG